MHEGAVRDPVDDTSYFLISYSHTQRNDQGTDRKPDHWVMLFYRDLSRNVEELAGAPGTRVGLLDRELWVENDWLAGLPQALASCHVLVPLYSHRYFQSEPCGREWYAFASRLANENARRAQAPAIVPVMWLPMAPSSIHPAARTVPIDYGGINSYVELGLDGIMKQARYRPDYEKVVRTVAEQVLATARRSAAGPWPVVEFNSLPNLFAPASVPGPGTSRLLVTVLAPQRDELPSGRDVQYYGAAAWDWAPYWPTSNDPIAQYTANSARRMGFSPYVGDLRERENDLLVDGPAAHPELLIIDPWAAARPESRRLLAQCRLADKPWVQVVIPWNPADGGIAAEQARLRSALDATLPRKLAQGRVTSEIAVEGVPSIEAFGAVLPLLILAAAKRYLEHAPAVPPEGPIVEKPRLGRFEPDPMDLLE